MGTRGRTSSAALSVSSQVTAIQRPDAPYDLTDEQADVWRSTVEALPADWFTPETFGLLTSYCRHVVEERHIAQLVHAIKQAEQLDARNYVELLKAMARESQAIGSLATRMRISQQSTYDRKKSKGGGNLLKRPWD